MSPRLLATVLLAAAASGCAVLTPPLRWPAVFPGWEASPDEEYDTALRAEAIVAGFPAVAAAVRPQAAPPSGGSLPVPVEVIQTVEVVPARTEEDEAPGFLSSAGLLQAVVEDESGARVGEIADVLVARESGTIAGLIVQRADGTPRFLATCALAWSDGSSPPRALEVEPADLRELFAAEDLETVAGELAEVVPAAPPSGAAELRVRDAGNLLHRVQIAAPELVLPRLPELVPGVAVTVRAVPTRDAQGKMWIAASVTRGEVTVRIRDEAGALLWSELSSAPAVLHGIEGYSFEADGNLHRITGWELAPDEPRIHRVQVATAGETRWMDWSEVAARKPWK